MRENRTYGSEGGEAKAFPTPIADAPQRLAPRWRGPQQEPANAKVFGL